MYCVVNVVHCACTCMIIFTSHPQMVVWLVRYTQSQDSHRFSLIFLFFLLGTVTSALELGGTQIFKTVQYFIKYHSINDYHGTELTQTNTLTHPVQYST